VRRRSTLERAHGRDSSTILGGFRLSGRAAPRPPPSRRGEARAERAVAAHVGFFADYAGQSSWSPSRGELRAISVPVALVTGPATAAHVVAAADAIERLVPGARRVDDGDVVGAVLALEAPGPRVGLRRPTAPQGCNARAKAVGPARRSAGLLRADRMNN